MNLMRAIGKSTTIGLLLWAAAAAAADSRTLVELPETMQMHMLANMRDHLAALAAIQAALADGAPARAGEIAETRLGMSSLQTHGAAHMAPWMPAEMRRLGTAMHRSASRFARVAEEVAAGAGDGGRPLQQGLADLTGRCVACHAAYRIR